MPEVTRSEVMTWTDDEDGQGVEVVWSSDAEDLVDFGSDNQTVSLVLDVDSIPAAVRALAAAYTHLTGKKVRLDDDA